MTPRGEGWPFSFPREELEDLTPNELEELRDQLRDQLLSFIEEIKDNRRRCGELREAGLRAIARKHGIPWDAGAGAPAAIRRLDGRAGGAR